MRTNIKNGRFIKCLSCGKEKYYPLSHILLGAKFCSRSCSSKITKNGRYSLGVKRGPPSQETIKKISLSQKGIKFSQARKKKLKIAAQRRVSLGIGCGANHYRWIFDRNKLKKRGERNDPAYVEWVKSVYKRDNRRCRLMNADCKGRIEAHHIFSWAEYPKLRYIIGNGITLCHFHHPRKRKEVERLSPYFKEIINNIKNNAQ